MADERAPAQGEPRPGGGGGGAGRRRRGAAGAAANRRRAARLGAVQALYQAEVTGAPVHQVLAEFQTYRLGNLLEPLGVEGPAPEVDRDWFVRVVRGAAEAAPGQLDPLIEERLAEGWTLRRLGYPLRACLRAGAFELAHCPDVPARVVISEYIEVARAFFHGDEPRFVNAVLDRLAKRLRPEEAQAQP